jgi:2-iminobutanoate/2-iminopropanoate deaminase
MQKNAVRSSDAPAPIGPYSQGIIAGGMLYVSGQIGLDPRSLQLVEGGVAAQTERVMENISAILRAGNSSFAQVVRVEIFLRDLAHYAAVNVIYGRYFIGDSLPSRYVVEVSQLPREALLEVAAIACVS